MMPTSAGNMYWVKRSTHCQGDYLSEPVLVEDSRIGYVAYDMLLQPLQDYSCLDLRATTFEYAPFVTVASNQEGLNNNAYDGIEVNHGRRECYEY
jgi:hypothetical protein